MRHRLRQDFNVDQVAFSWATDADGVPELGGVDLAVAEPPRLEAIQRGTSLTVAPDLCPRSLTEVVEAANAYVDAVAASRSGREADVPERGDGQVIQVGFADTFIDVAYSTSASEEPRVIVTELLQVDPDLCDEELGELMDAIVDFVNDVKVAHRAPPDTIPA